MPVVKVEQVGKVYPPSPPWMKVLLRTSIREPVVALGEVSLEVRPGQICAVVGPNGAGKSTLFRVLTGLTTPTTGAASILGLDVTTQAHEVRKHVGFMPAEDRTLLLRQTCRENLDFHGRLQGIRESRLRPAVDETLDLVGLGEAKDRVGFALSSGMRARLMLARAILHEPAVLILDEPTGAVDPIGSHQLIAMIQRITEERRVAVLLSSHRLDEIETLHHNILLLNRGTTLYWGSLDALRALWEQPPIEIRFDQHVAADRAASFLDSVGDVQVTRGGETSLLVNSGLTVGELLTLLDGQVARVASIRRSEVRLQELLVRIVDEQSSEATKA